MAYKREHVKERFRPKPGKLLDQVREVVRYHHYAIRTEQMYIKWILDYIRFNGTRDPREMGKPELEQFLSHSEISQFFQHISGTNELMAKLLYGAGLRLMECVRLRVKDLDFENHQIIVRDGKGEKDRATVLPKTIQEDLWFHLKGGQKAF